MQSLHRRASRTPRRRWAARCVLAGTIALLVATGSTTALAQPTTTPAVPTTAAQSAPATSSTPDVPATTERVKPAPPSSADRQVPDTPSVPTAAVPSSSPVTAPPGAEPSVPAGHAPADPPSAAPTRKAPAGEWTPTENPNATVVPGKMRSDREEIPEGFTKEQADLAETMEAQQQSSRMSLMSLPCTTYWPAPFLVCGEIRVKYDSLGGPNSFLLWPTSNELVNPDQVGRRQTF